MLRLFIDNQEVYLDAEIDFQIFRENPLFRKTGDYTFNIDINIRCKNNSQVYSNIRKIGNHFSVKNRKAVLMDGNEELLNGTEVILSADEKKVSIQIVNGVSELNYLTNSDSTRVRELDLGYIQRFDRNMARSLANENYPNSTLQAPPIYIGGNLLNHVNIFYDGFEFNGPLQPQPYLLYYTNAVIEAIGYKMKFNQLATIDKWKRLLLIHGYDTMFLAKMLPNWTVSQFIDEIEKFFNAIYVVDSKTKEVQLLTIKDFYKNKQPIVINRDKIVDAFQRTYRDDEEREDLYITYQNVKYSFPKDKGYELCDLPDDIMRRLSISEGNYDAITAVDDNWDDWSGYQDSEKANFLFKPYMRYQASEESSSREYFKRRLNEFAEYRKNEDGNTVTMKIIPAHIIQDMTTATNQGDMIITVGNYQIPAVDYHEYKDEKIGFYETVNGQEVEQDVEDCITVAFFEGNAHIRTSGNNYVYHYAMPMCWTSEWTAGKITANTFREEEIEGFIGMTLELNGENGRGINDFDSDFNINHDQRYTIKFLCSEFLDPMSVFELDGVKFACEKLTYNWTQGKRDKIVEGEFYRIIDN